MGWLRRATAALAGRWSRLRGAAPPRLCHAASPIPQCQRPERLFLAGPAKSVHTRAASLSGFNAMDLGSSKSLQATAMIPAWPRRPRHQKRLVDKTPICTVSCTNIVQQQQQQPASSPWIVGCKGGGALAVPRMPQRSPVLLVGSRQLRSPSRPSLRATPRRAQCLAMSKSPACSSRPTLSDVCRPPSRQQYSGMLQILGSVTCVW